MTKMIKMSLIAAVAVTGITSTVSAQPLEDAIKGVDVSGMLRYRYDDTKTDNTASTQTNEYVFEVNTKSKVNDVITANVSVVAQGVNIDGNAYESAQATSDATGDRDINLVVEQANFSAALGFATVIAGKQNIPGPFVDAVDVTRQGTGAVALIPVAGLTVAAGHFVNHDIITTSKKTAGVETYTGVDALTTTANATELAVIGKVADVSADIWYANVTDTLTAYSLHANATVAGVNVDARYTSMDMSDAYSALGLSGAVAGKDTATLTKIVASTKVGEATLVAAYAVTGDDNGKFENRVAIDKDNDAQSDFRLWQHSAGQLADATALLIGAGMDVMPNVNLDVKYLTVDCDAVKDASELLVGATYKMSKNFGVHARYSMAETGSVDTSKGRLELKYTF